MNNTYRGLMDERDDWRQQFDTACEMIQQQSAEIELLRVDVEQAELRIAALQATIAGLHAKVRRR